MTLQAALESFEAFEKTLLRYNPGQEPSRTSRNTECCATTEHPRRNKRLCSAASSSAIKI